MSLTYIIVGAHPDDDEISAGVTALLALKNNDKVISVSMTSGEGRDQDVRLAEWEEANRRMNYTDTVMLGFPDKKLPRYTLEMIEALDELRKKYNPDIAIFHSDKDTHQDHRAVNEACITAFRNGPDLLQMQAPSVKPALYQPHKFVITDDIEVAFQKAWAVGAYVSQRNIAHPETMLIHLATWGRSARTQQKHVDLSEIVDGKHDDLIDRLTQWDPLEYGCQIKNLKDFYRSALMLIRPGTIFAEVFEPNHEYHRF